jgi:hypothetical protein
MTDSFLDNCTLVNNFQFLLPVALRSDKPYNLTSMAASSTKGSTELLQHTIAEVEKLPTEEQNAIAKIPTFC